MPLAARPMHEQCSTAASIGLPIYGLDSCPTNPVNASLNQRCEMSVTSGQPAFVENRLETDFCLRSAPTTSSLVCAYFNGYFSDSSGLSNFRRQLCVHCTHSTVPPLSALFRLICLFAVLPLRLLSRCVSDGLAASLMTYLLGFPGWRWVALLTLLLMTFADGSLVVCRV